MNKILKHLVGLFIIGIGILNMCNADDIYTDVIQAQQIYSINNVNLNSSSYTNLFNYNNPTTNGFIPMLSGAGTYCIRFYCETAGCQKTLDMGFANGPTTAPSNLYKMYEDQYEKFVCLFGNKPYLNAKLNSSTNNVNVQVFNLQQLLNSELPCPTCQNEAILHVTDGIFTDNLTVTSGQSIYVINQKIDEIQTYGNNIAFRMQACEECTACNTGAILSGYILESSINTAYCTGHNLCPACEQCEQCQTCPTIDAQYCMNNFNLIPPAYCPICGTGDVNWSSLYINGTQYNSNEMIDIHTENQMEIDVEYLNDTVDIDITYGQDEEYIENIIQQEKLTPTNEDLAYIIENLGNYIPIIAITLLLLLIRRILKRVFK